MEQFEFHDALKLPSRRRKKQPKEWKLVALRECPTPEHLQLCDTPERAVTYWKLHVPSAPQYSPQCECFVAILLNTRRRIIGHYFISTGTLDTILVHPREVFRVAIVAAAAAIL